MLGLREIAVNLEGKNRGNFGNGLISEIFRD